LASLALRQLIMARPIVLLLRLRRWFALEWRHSGIADRASLRRIITPISEADGVGVLIITEADLTGTVNSQTLNWQRQTAAEFFRGFFLEEHGIKFITHEDPKDEAAFRFFAARVFGVICLQRTRASFRCLQLGN
jgi:hypothetical protein